MDIKNFKLYRDHCYINGEWVKANSSEAISVNNPASLEEIGTVPKCGKDEAALAIESAHKARRGPPWSFRCALRQRVSSVAWAAGVWPRASSRLVL